MYYRIFGYVDTIDDASYPRMEKQSDGSKKEVMVKQFTFNLRIPGQKDFTRVTVLEEVEGFPNKDTRDKWEDVETLVVVEADRLTTVAGGGDEGSKAWAFASFNGIKIDAASQADSQAIKQRRKTIKEQHHTRREQARKEKEAAKVQKKVA